MASASPSASASFQRKVASSTWAAVGQSQYRAWYSRHGEPRPPGFNGAHPVCDVAAAATTTKASLDAKGAKLFALSRQHVNNAGIGSMQVSEMPSDKESFFRF
jgi:hypothetical protein